MPHVALFNSDTWFNVAETVLFGGHPIRTLETWLYGEHVSADQIRRIAHESGLQRSDSYRNLIEQRQGPNYRENAAHVITGRVYYDAKHDETVLRVRATRMRLPSDDDPYPVSEPKTFLLKGKHLPKS